MIRDNILASQNGDSAEAFPGDRDNGQFAGTVSKVLESHEGAAIRAAATPEAPAWVTRGRVPCLDGIRAISILLVILQHQMDTRGFSSPRFLNWPKTWGTTGVNIFFVISGFLITLLLLRERQRSGTISLRAFYARRSLRILPAYCLYMLVVAVLVKCGVIFVGDWRVWLGALTFTTSFMAGIIPHWSYNSWVFSHLWSLSVEEHFYLLWPLVMLFMNRRRAVKVVIAVLCLSPVNRYLWWRFGHHVDIDFFTLTRIDTIAAGCLLALLVSSGKFWARTSALRQHPLPLFMLSVAALIVSHCFLARSGKYQLTVENPFEAICIAACIFFLAQDACGISGQILNSKPLVALGVLSYSLYLWQQLFMFPTYTTHSWLCPWPLNVLLAFSAAIASYFLVERLFLQLKDRLAFFQ